MIMKHNGAKAERERIYHYCCPICKHRAEASRIQPQSELKQKHSGDDENNK